MRESSPPEAMRASGAALRPGSGRGGTRPSPAPLRPGRRVVGGAGGAVGRERDLEPRALHGQQRELALDFLSRSRAACGACARAGWPRPGSGRQGLTLLAQRALALFRRAEVAQLRAALLAERDHVLDGGAVLALEAIDEGQPALDLVEPAGADLKGLAVVAQEQGEIVELGAHGAARLDVGPEARIDARELLDLAIDVAEPRQHGLFVFVEGAVSSPDSSASRPALACSRFSWRKASSSPSAARPSRSRPPGTRASRGGARPRGGRGAAIRARPRPRAGGGTAPPWPPRSPSSPAWRSTRSRCVWGSSSPAARAARGCGR
jgi:hypothetical protein